MAERQRVVMIKSQERSLFLKILQSCKIPFLYFFSYTLFWDLFALCWWLEMEKSEIKFF